MQFTEESRSTGAVEETLGCVRLRRGADDEVNYSLRRSTGISKQRGLIVGEYIGMERLETLQGCVKILTADHVNELFQEAFRGHRGVCV